MTKRLVIHGGGFDPPHRGHDVVLQAALAWGADLVLLTPTADDPGHKAATLTPREVRLGWVQGWASRYDDRVGVCDWQITEQVGECSASLLAAVHRAFDGWDVAMVLGADQLASLPTWACPQKVLKRAHLLIVPRGGCPIDTAAVRWVYRMGGSLELLPLREVVHESSTALRAELAQGIMSQGRLAPGVEYQARERAAA